jgi:hypothetical protein
MSVRKTAAAKVATKPTAKLAPAPAKRTNTKKAAKSPPTKSASGAIQNLSAAAEQLAVEVDRAQRQFSAARGAQPGHVDRRHGHGKRLVEGGQSRGF